MESIIGLAAALSAALFAGGALYVSLVEHPARKSDPVANGRRQFYLSYHFAAPRQASLAAICFVTAWIASLLSHRWSFAVGGTLVGAVIPYTLLVMMPTNHRITGGETMNADETFLTLRHWGRLHWVRTALGIAGLLIILAYDMH